MDINDIKVYYSKFDNHQIEKIATEEVASLRPEVIEILKAEIEKRKLDPRLLDSVNSQLIPLNEDAFISYCELLQQQPCPICKSRTQKINVSMVGKVISMILITHYRKEVKIACSYCLDEMNKKAIIQTVFLGWWGFPWGPIDTIKSFIFNSKMKKNHRTTTPNEIYTSFVLGNIGVFEQAKTTPKKLTQLIHKTNAA